MAIFNSYVSLPEGNQTIRIPHWCPYLDDFPLMIKHMAPADASIFPGSGWLRDQPVNQYY